MGIRRLKTFATKRGGAESLRLEPGTTLLIDASGLTNFVARGQRFELAGDYAAMENTIESYFTKLLLAGFILRVFEDGKDRRLKEKTRHERLAIRTEEWTALRNWLSRDVSIRKGESPSVDFPLPPLAHKCVQYEIRRHQQVEIIECSEEADQEIARASARGEGVIVGEDSDFLLFKGVRYMPLQELDNLVDNKPVGVWTRSRLAHLLEVEEDGSKIVDFAFLLGNDYGGHLSLCAFANVDGLEESQRRDPEALLEWIHDQPPEWQLESDEPSLAFSRRLYNLETLDDFPVDPKLDIRALDGSPTPFPDGSELISDEGDNIAVYEATSAAIASMAESRGLHDSDTLRALCAAPGFREDYAGAVLEMLDGDCLSIACAERWEDAVAAYRYQRALESGLSVDKIVRISDLYCGETFHALLRRRRRGGDEVEDVLEESICRSDAAGDHPQSCVLPIDAHKEHILDHISRHQVTIIVGETGCGKSSRLPVFLLDESKRAKMFVTQPRRIAARSLCDRVRSTLPLEKKAWCGLRLGHGERDEHSGRTRLWFCTNGYLVRLLASYPQAFKEHTHLVIDEVHERSVDNEVLCLLARRLLKSHPDIKIVLMSATLCQELYIDYFGMSTSTEESNHVFVGARRFQNTEFFADDVVSRLGGMPKQVGATAQKLEVASSKPGEHFSTHLSRLQLDLAIAIVERIGTGSSSILIFVAGMNDIINFTDRIARLNTHLEASGASRRRFVTLPIHSDVPYDDQARVFATSDDPNLVRVVIATNAAESSVTIPDCDHVICLGVAKQLEYDCTTHRQILHASWISRSSAIQRAGRTGRLRPGRVYRLYSRFRFEHLMREHDISDIHRTPLDSVVLNFYTLLGGKTDESIAKLLGETLEPPEPANIARAFESLHESKFLSEANETGVLTTMGRFVAALGLDLQLGRLVGLGAQLDCFDEAVDLAAILSQPQSPFRIANPLIHEVAEYNEVASSAFASRLAWDAGVRSEPIAILRLLGAFDSLTPKTAEKRRHFCKLNAIVLSRIVQLSSSARHLRDRALAALRTRVSAGPRFGRHLKSSQDVGTIAYSGLASRELRRPSGDVANDPVRLNRLRLLLTWTARENVFRLKGTRNPVTKLPITDMRVMITGPTITVANIEPLRLPGSWSLIGGTRKYYSANIGADRTFDFASTEERFLEMTFGSHASGPLDVAWITIQGKLDTRCVLLLSQQARGAKDVVMGELQNKTDVIIRERQVPSGPPDLYVAEIVVPSISKVASKAFKQLHQYFSMVGVAYNRDGLLTCVCSRCDIKPQYHLANLIGYRPFDPTCPTFKVLSVKDQQMMSFQMNQEIDTEGSELHTDMPISARHVAALVSGHRDMKLKLQGAKPDDAIIELKLAIPTPVYCCAFGTRQNRKIFMGDHTLAKIDVNLRNATNKPHTDQFGVAATMIDIGRDTARASGVTILPPGPLWLARALAAFGIESFCDWLDERDLSIIEEIMSCAERASETLEHVPELTDRLDNLFCSPRPGAHEKEDVCVGRLTAQNLALVQSSREETDPNAYIQSPILMPDLNLGADIASNPLHHRPMKNDRKSRQPKTQFKNSKKSADDAETKSQERAAASMPNKATKRMKEAQKKKQGDGKISKRSIKRKGNSQNADKRDCLPP